MFNKILIEKYNKGADLFYIFSQKNEKEKIYDSIKMFSTKVCLMKKKIENEFGVFVNFRCVVYITKKEKVAIRKYWLKNAVNKNNCEMMLDIPFLFSKEIKFPTAHQAKNVTINPGKIDLYGIDKFEKYFNNYCNHLNEFVYFINKPKKTLNAYKSLMLFKGIYNPVFEK